MTPEQRFALEHQTKAWLNAMRAAWVSRYGLERGECPVPRWEAVPQRDRVILMTAVDAANKAGRPENVERARQRALDAQQPS